MWSATISLFAGDGMPEELAGVFLFLAGPDATYITGESDTPCEFVRGHHLTLGEAFLGGESRLDAPAKTILTLEALYEPGTARLAPGQCSSWPNARDRQGGMKYLGDADGRQNERPEYRQAN
jgi:hypothetical protein